MMRRRFIAGLTLVSMLMPLGASAAAANSCEEQIYARLSQENRLYRSVLFGLSKAEDMPIGSVITADEGDSWLKVSDNNWRSPIHSGFIWNDRLAEERRDVPARRGILETQQALSSELVPSVLQAFRAMQCRLQAVCLTAQLTQSTPQGQPVKVQPAGCIAFEMPAMDTCRPVKNVPVNNGGCNEQVQAILERESHILELIFAYDASYRSLMQFAGTFEGFLTDFRFPLLEPLWQMVRTLGQFDDLPCFLAECNE